MPLINLIQEQRAEAKKAERRSRTLLAVFVASAATSTLCFLLLGVETARLQINVSRLTGEKQRLAPLMKQISDNEAMAAGLSPKLDTLGKAQKTSERWQRILEHMSTETPADSWLTGIRAASSDATKPVVATFTGVALSQAPVSELLFRMENSNDLDNVTLKFTQEKVVAANKQTEFQIDADIAGTAEAPPVKPEDKKS